MEGTMATYEYTCGKCGAQFVRIEAMSVHGRRRPTCPKCKSRKVTQRFTPFFAKTAKKS
jgi:putative FmdB family regulatory protein